MIVYSSIDIVDKGRPCLVINCNNTWFLVMCGLHYTCIHVEYNYSLHDLDVELSFSWCLIMLITTKIKKGESLFCGFDEIHCQRGRNFPHILHTTFCTMFWVCVLYTYFWIFCWFYFFTFSFQNLENLKVKWICMPINVWCLCDVANVFIKGEIVKPCVMCNIGEC